ncbi:LacI family DNA-binding transcriptional regulator [bacterium]|nr:LacI family DNA-binding transcriptional regulator [bacterium]
MITIKDIASRLNISVSTVSRALRNHPDISTETKRRVIAMADELDYHPNAIAQSLKRNRTNLIGVIVPQVKHDFFATVMSGIADVAYNAGYSVMIFQSNETYEREVLNVKAVMAQRAAGFLVSISKATKNYDHFLQLVDKDIPIVFFDRGCDEIPVSQVVVDDYDGAYQLVRHLIDTGYRRIAHLAGPEYLSIGKQRLDGYRDALKEAGMPFDPALVVTGGLNEEDGLSGFNRLQEQCPQFPDAIFAVTDPVAYGVFQRLREHRYRIPDDVALAGFSDSNIASLLDPPLTTVRQPTYEIGQEAMNVLHRLIQQKQRTYRLKKYVLKTELVVRESTLKKSSTGGRKYE